MARKTHWKALTKSQRETRRFWRRNGLLIAIFGRRKGEAPCCTWANPCCPRRDWIDDFRPAVFHKNGQV